MAILSDKDIKEHLKSGKIVINPLTNPKVQIQPSSVDLRIGREFKGFRIIRKPCIDPMDQSDLESYMESFYIDEGEPFIIHPGEFALATTYETSGSCGGAFFNGKIGSDNACYCWLYRPRIPW